MTGRPDGGAIPIVAMTANAFAGDVQDSINASMTKPIDPELLYAVLRRYSRRSTQGDDRGEKGRCPGLTRHFLPRYTVSVNFALSVLTGAIEYGQSSQKAAMQSYRACKMAASCRKMSTRAAIDCISIAALFRPVGRERT